MRPRRYYKISPKLRFHYLCLTSWRSYLWLFAIITTISLFLCFFVYSWANISRHDWFIKYCHIKAHGCKGSYENYIQSLLIGSIYESALFTTIWLIAIIISMLLLRFALWLLDNLCSIIACGQYVRMVHFSNIFPFIGWIQKKYRSFRI